MYMKIMKDKETVKMTKNYVITGISRDGRRFKPIHTTTPQHYNIWQGTIWELVEGKRKKVREIFN